MEIGGRTGRNEEGPIELSLAAYRVLQRYRYFSSDIGWLTLVKDW